jgi:hypothetical protein
MVNWFAYVRINDNSLRQPSIRSIHEGSQRGGTDGRGYKAHD